MASETDDTTTKIYCKCGSTVYEPIDNRTKEVLTLVCVECGDEQEWKLRE